MISVVMQNGSERRRLMRQAVEALGDPFFERVKAARSIFVKVDLSHHERQLTSTHVDAVRGLLDIIFSEARPEVTIGDGGFTGTVSAFHNFGFDRLLSEYPHAMLVDLNTAPCQEGFILDELGGRIPIRRSRMVAEADLRISLTPLKIHREYGVALSVLNWVLGTWIVPSRVSPRGLVYARSPWLSHGLRAAHESLVELWRQAPCDIGIIDGIDAMEGDGPFEGSHVPFDIILAGMDPVAVDVVGASLMDIEPEEIHYLQRCGEERLGIANFSQINIPPLALLEQKRHFARPVGFEERLREAHS
ncbi:MAG: DUF362 domain-containing protein [Patescibacteria group bacterium]|jgi:uncharacterized protein (DUF362 family)